ncbi:DNA damage-inducible protein D [Patescibacteria group bacterium]|nr:DNA damage-inducible protein D [Patescibacteria group bacterium]
MQHQQLELLPKNLDEISHEENGDKYWEARDLYTVLGYASWDGFVGSLDRAIESCNTAGDEVEHHFRQVTKMVDIGSGAKRPLVDYRLTRYACYLIALNGDPKLPYIALAQAYFATLTRRQEVLQTRMQEIERVASRRRLKKTESEFQTLIFERGVDGPGIGEVRDAGDKMLFGGYTTREMKNKLGVAQKNPIADVLATVLIKAKDFAAQITTLTIQRNSLSGKNPIKTAHIKSNTNVRVALTSTGITPEELPAAEDIKMIERRHEKDRKLLSQRHMKELGETLTKNSE